MLYKRLKRLFGTKKKTIHEQYPQYCIGRNTYGKLRVLSWGEKATLQIGAFCSIADVKIFLGGEHRTDWVTTFPFSVKWDAAKRIEGHPRTKGDVIIGNDVWLGSDVVILSGVKIGDGAVVGTRSVVTKEVPPYSICVGNPGRVVRKRFDDETIRRLLAIKWWEWGDEKIEKFLPLLLSNDVQAFLQSAEKQF